MSINEKNWTDKKLNNHYVYLHKYLNDYLFNLKFGSYYSSKLTLKYLNEFKNYNLLEIGIGAGNFLRLLKINKISNHYTGADINENYINLAKKIHNYKDFYITDKNLEKNLEEKYDIVYSRNVALHQTDPYFFIDNLIHKTKNILIIELKTRDKGETILDTNYSCQIVDGVWIPYIVLNLDELKDFLSNHKLCQNSDVTINREYTILGGKNLRHLEKSLFEKETGGANTTLTISLNSKNQIEKNKLNQIKFYETFNHDDKIKKNLKYYFNIFIRKIKSLI